MSAQDLSLLSDFTSQIVQVHEPRVVRLMNQRAPFASLLDVRLSGPAKSVDWEAQLPTSGTSGAQFVNEGSDATNFAANGQIIPTIGFSELQYALKLSSKALHSIGTGNSQEIQNLWSERFLQGTSAIADLIETAALFGTGSAGLVGVLTGSDSTTTYAGISKTAYPDFAGNVLANSGTPRNLTVALLDQMIEQVEADIGPILSSDYVYVFNPSQRNKLTGLSSANVRYDASTGAPVANTGFTAYTHMNIPIVFAHKMPAGKGALVNRQYTYFKAIDPQERLDAVWQTKFNVFGTSGYSTVNTGIPVQWYSLGAKGAYMASALFGLIALIQARPQANCLIHDLS